MTQTPGYTPPLNGDDRDQRCVVVLGWAKGTRGTITGRTGTADYFTVQLDDGRRFCAKPGEVAPLSQTPYRRAERTLSREATR